MIFLKWTKAQWMKEHREATGIIDPTPGAADYIETQLDIFHKTPWFKTKKLKLALENLCAILEEYNGKDQPEAVKRIIARRLKQCSKTLIKYGNAMKYADKLTLEQIRKKPYVLEAFRAFLASEFSLENLEFLEDVDARLGPVIIIPKFIVSGAPKEVNIPGTLRKQIVSWNNEDGVKLAVPVVEDMIMRDSLPRFRKSKLLEDALFKTYGRAG